MHSVSIPLGGLISAKNFGFLGESILDIKGDVQIVDDRINIYYFQDVVPDVIARMILYEQ